LLLLFLGVRGLTGCSPSQSESGGSEQSAFKGEEREVVDAAARAVRQFDDWGSRVEYTTKKTPSGWQVTAWRVEHPEAKGNARYVPWGFRVIVVDRRGKVIDYKNSR
jgi:hypothetical protein